MLFTSKRRTNHHEGIKKRVNSFKDKITCCTIIIVICKQEWKKFLLQVLMLPSTLYEQKHWLTAKQFFLFLFMSRVNEILFFNLALNNTTLAQVVVYREIEYSRQKIATQLGLISTSTPRISYNRYIKNGSLDQGKPTGRPCKISERVERFIVRWLERDPFVSAE